MLKTMFDEFHEIAGWVGMSLILAGYAGVSMELLSAQALLYQAMNAIGSVALIYSTYKTKSYPVLVLNVVWLIVALIALSRLF